MPINEEALEEIEVIVGGEPKKKSSILGATAKAATKMALPAGTVVTKSCGKYTYQTTLAVAPIGLVDAHAGIFVCGVSVVLLSVLVTKRFFSRTKTRKQVNK